MKTKTKLKIKLKVNTMALIKPETTKAEAKAQVEEEVVESTEEVETAETTETAQAEDKAEETITETEVAVVQTTAVSTAPSAGMNMDSIIADQEAAGFHGMEISSFSFDRVTLDTGEFVKGEGKESIGKEFTFQPLASQPLYVVRQHKNQDAEMFYTYDKEGKLKADGTSAKDILDAWLEDGYGTPESPLEIKTYLEVVADILDGEAAGETVILSIPPASIAKYSGLGLLARKKFGANNIGEAVIQAKVGAKVTSGKNSYNPWRFQVVGLA